MTTPRDVPEPVDVPLAAVELPAGLTPTRTTPEFNAGTVPTGLLAAHRVADGVWGLLRVVAGEVVFVLEESGVQRSMTTGTTQVIQPGVYHHVELSADARFVVEFHSDAG